MDDHEALPQQNSPLALALLERIRLYARHSNLSVSRICGLAVNDGKFADRLAQGRTCSIATYEKFMAWLDSREAQPEQRESAA